MADEPNQSQSPPRNARRSSFAGQTFAEIFSSGGRQSINRGSTDAPPPAPSSPPAPQPVGPISKAAQQAQQRRLSLTTLGLSGSPNQSSPFAPFRSRGDSIGSASANSGSIDDSAIAEDEAPRDQGNGSPTNTPFARRTSFGARALRDIRGNSFSGGGGSPGSPGQNGTNPPSSNDTSASKANAQTSKANAQKNGTISSRDAKGRGLSLAPPTISPPALSSHLLPTHHLLTFV